MIKYKHIEASREVRLWIGQVIVPGTIAAMMIWNNPDARCAIKQKTNEIKHKVKRVFKR